MYTSVHQSSRGAPAERMHIINKMRSIVLLTALVFIKYLQFILRYTSAVIAACRQLSATRWPPNAERRRAGDYFGLQSRRPSAAARRHYDGRTTPRPGTRSRHFGQSHPAVRRGPTANPLIACHGRRDIQKPDARTAAERVLETDSEFVVHPAVDDWIIAAVTHCQPMAGNPHRLNVAKPTNNG